MNCQAQNVSTARRTWQHSLLIVLDELAVLPVNGRQQLRLAACNENHIAVFHNSVNSGFYTSTLKTPALIVH